MLMFMTPYVSSATLSAILFVTDLPDRTIIKVFLGKQLGMKSCFSSLLTFLNGTKYSGEQNCLNNRG
jgi:hypothetical protein